MSDCDDEPYRADYVCEPHNVKSHEPSSRWKWALVISAWAAAAVALAIVVDMAYAALTPHQQPSQPQQQKVTSVLNDGTSAPFPPDKSQNT